VQPPRRQVGPVARIHQRPPRGAGSVNRSANNA
jgi:hypothetical protein